MSTPKIRIKNDIRVFIDMTTSSSGEVSFEPEDIKEIVAYNDVQKSRTKLDIVFDDDNNLYADFKADKQCYLGDYRIVVYFDNGHRATWDNPAFTLVEFSADADTDTGLVVVDIEGEMKVISVAELAQAEVNETQRKANEVQRQANETARISAESARSVAEQGRASAETSRVSAETIRQQNDTAREGRIAALESAMPNKYQKPSSGIPKTDLSSDVQSSLGKADTALQSHQDISGKADKSELLGCVTSRMLVYYSGTSAAITTSSNVVGVFAYYGAESMDVDYSVFNGLVTITWNGVTPSSSCPIRIVLMEQTMPTEFIGGDDAWQYGDVVPNFSGSFGEASGYISTESGDVLCDNNNNVIGF